MSHFQFPFGINLKWNGVSDIVQRALFPCRTELLLFALTQKEKKNRKKKLKSAEQL